MNDTHLPDNVCVRQDEGLVLNRLLATCDGLDRMQATSLRTIILTD